MPARGDTRRQPTLLRRPLRFHSIRMEPSLAANCFSGKEEMGRDNGKLQDPVPSAARPGLAAAPGLRLLSTGDALARRAPSLKRMGNPAFSYGAAGPQGSGWRRRGLEVRCQTAATTLVVNKDDAAAAPPAAAGFTVVMKFGGSSLASAERMREVAKLVLAFLNETPVVVLSAMGKTTNNLLLAGQKAVSCGATKVSQIPELAVIKELHLRTVDELGLDRSIVSGLLDELEQLLKGVAMMKELTLRTRDYLVSIGECMSTRIFAAYLNKLGKKARRYDAFDMGFITTNDFTNVDILGFIYPDVAKRLQGDWIDDPAIPVVVDFLGRGGSDLTAKAIGKAMGLRVIQVWKDVDGLLTCDPSKYLSFNKEAGLQIIKNEDLEEIRELDSGTFGTVYHGKWRGADVAIKRLKKSCFIGQYSMQEKPEDGFWQETEIMSKLHRPNVLPFYGVVKDGPGGTLATVTEFMVDGSLRHVLQHKAKYLDNHKRLIIAMDAAFGMEYMHSKNIVHFDLKSANLLVNLKDKTRPICKVGDFGLSKIKINTLVSGGMRGTLPWMAPELISECSKVSEKVDVYSFGIVMWEILTGGVPYASLSMTYLETLLGVVNNTLRPPVPANCDPEWRRLMEQCWSHEPAQRPDFTEIALRLRAMLTAPNYAEAAAK